MNGDDPILYRSALAAGESGVILLDREGRVLLWNEWLASRSAIAVETAQGRTLEQLFEERLAPRIARAVEGALSHGRSSLLSQKLNRHPFPIYGDEAARRDGRRLLQMVTVKPLFDESKEGVAEGAASPRACLLQIFDVTRAAQREEALERLAGEAREAAERLRDNESRLRAILESTQDAILTFTEEGAIVEFNHSAARMFGIATSSMRRRAVHDLIQEFRLGHVAGAHRVGDLLADQGRHQGGNQSSQESIYSLSGRRADGTIFPIELSVSRLDLGGDEDNAYVGVIRDVTERRRAQERLEQLAQYDVLTGLANRSLFRDRLEQALMRTERGADGPVLLFLDLDRFKTINDTLGHDVGDELLREVANRLTACVRAGDTVARLGGDEFTVLLDQVPEEAMGAKVAEKVLQAMQQPVTAFGHELYVTTSIGLAGYPHGGTSADALLKNADTAMYRAKESGRNGYCYYSPEMNAIAQQRLALEADLRRALGAGQFKLYLQPQVNLLDGRVTGAEALIRWLHPERGFIPPDHFIPLAEDCGLIVEIGDWVMRAACAEARELARAGLDEFVVAVNVSPQQFRFAGIFDQIRGALDEEGVRPEQIELEITEGCVMENSERNIQLLEQLAEHGFRISMDDFGTGYSSLSYLRRFPLHKLKIDRSFVNDLPGDLEAIAISNAIIHMAHSLRLDVIAEGVESGEQLHFLSANRCQYAQGYHISRPMPAEDFLDWYRNYSETLRWATQPRAVAVAESCLV